MSLKQALVGLHHHIFRFRNANALRQRLGQFGQQVAHKEQAHVKEALRLRRQDVPDGSHPTSLFPSSIREFVRGLLSYTPVMVHRAHHFAGHVGRFVAHGPGRTVAPLLGFIAAFLQESKTEEYKTESACVAVRDEVNEFSKDLLDGVKMDASTFRKASDLEFGRSLGKGCNAAVYEARLKSQPRTEDYSLAVKVLFNYSMHSDAEALSRYFENEMLPSRLNHRNIIDVFQSCVDEIPVLPGSETLFPAALPQGRHPEGYGRSQTMFVLMNKYTCTLRDDLLKRGKAYELKEGLAVLAQLLEGVAKLGRENIVHRDIKTDNVLLARADDGSVDRAVISDFGCSLTSLRLHFPVASVSRGGNRALMPPEIINSEAGLLTFLDYGRADLWSVGTIAYEILTGFNPFFEGVFTLSSSTYEESQLPEVIPGNEPLNNLVRSILRRNPNKRPSPAVAATACHMLLWAFPLDVGKPSVEDVHGWIMRLCVRLICGARTGLEQRALLAAFLRRCNVAEIMQAWTFLQNDV